MPSEHFGAFISYARAASGKLAIDLQNELERFAKPWNRLRAIRVFRDDSSMSANSALWSAIEKGLQESGWFVLLATPEAAASQYVNNEVAWWVAHKGAATILLVQASGTLSWNRALGEFTSDTDVIPPALRAAYAEEPRWVDLRWYGEEGSIGKADPRFAERVADLSSAIRGIERDTLIGENVRQHRKSRRFQRVATAGLSVLLVAALAATGVAVAQSREAIRQRNVAVEQTEIATARLLAASSQSLLMSDTATARLLAVNGYEMYNDTRTRAALLASVLTNPSVVDQIDVGSTVTATAGSVDGTRIAIGTQSGDVLVWDRMTGETVVIGSVDGPVTGLSASDDGSVVAATTRDTYGEVESGGVWVDGQQRLLPEDFSGAIAVSPTGNTVAFAMMPSSEPDPTDFYADESLGYLQRSAPGEDYILYPQSGAYERWIVKLEVPSDEVVVAMLDEENGGVEHRRLSDFALIASGGGSLVPRYLPAELSPGGRYIISAIQDGEVDVFDTTREVDLRGWDTDEGAFLRGSYVGAAASAVAGNADGTRTAVASAGVIYLSTTLAGADQEATPLVLEGGGAVTIGTLKFLGDATLVSASGSRVTIWNPDKQDALIERTPTSAPLIRDIQRAPTLHVSPDGSYAVSNTGPGTTTTGNKYYVSRGGDEGASTWYDLEDGSWETSDLFFLAWGEGSEAFFAGDGKIYLYRDGFTAKLDEWEVPALAWTLNESSGTMVTSSRAGRYDAEVGELVVATTAGVYTLDATTGSMVSELPGVVASSLSANGVYAVGSVLTETAGTESEFRRVVTNLETGEQTDLEGLVTFDEGARYQGDVLVVANPRRYADGYAGSGKASLWSADGSDYLGSVEENPWNLAILSPDHSFYARYDENGRLELIDLASGTPVGSFALSEYQGRYYGNYPATDFSEDGKSLFVTENDTLYAIDLDPDSWARAACSTSDGELTDEEWMQFTGQRDPAPAVCSQYRDSGTG